MPTRLEMYEMNISFKGKSEDVAGLLLADLIAYPIARHILDPETGQILLLIRSHRNFTLKKVRFMD